MRILLAEDNAKVAGFTHEGLQQECHAAIRESCAEKSIPEPAPGELAIEQPTGEVPISIWQ